jgi:acyl carrier protein
LNTRFVEIENKIKELLASYLESSGHSELEKHGEISGFTDLVSDFTLDSFQVMEFLMEMEESFDIMIDMNNLSNTHTVNELAKVVDSLLED